MAVMGKSMILRSSDDVEYRREREREQQGNDDEEQLEGLAGSGWCPLCRPLTILLPSVAKRAASYIVGMGTNQMPPTLNGNDGGGGR